VAEELQPPAKDDANFINPNRMIGDLMSPQGFEPVAKVRYRRANHSTIPTRRSYMEPVVIIIHYKTCGYQLVILVQCSLVTSRFQFLDMFRLAAIFWDDTVYVYIFSRDVSDNIHCVCSLGMNRTRLVQRRETTQVFYCSL